MSRNFTYDGENRQVTANINGATSTYSYDGEGRRIRKASGFTTTIYVYDAFGKLAAEYANQTPASGTQYVHVDHLGSTRLVRDANGTPVTGGCHDYLPFGQEIVAGINGRGSCFPSAPSAGIEFTGKERDGETGLDFFGARDLSAAQGRFTSPDQPLIDQEPSDPQSWNLYSYVRNNPLVNIDPTGQDCVYINDDVSLERGNCSKKNGTYVSGTIDAKSFTYDPRKGTLGYSYTNNGALGAGVIAGVYPSRSESVAMTCLMRLPGAHRWRRRVSIWLRRA